MALKKAGRRIVIRENHMFSKVFKKGKYAANPFVTVYALPNYNKRAATRFGVSASAKLGGAPQRNRAKRVVREAYARLCGRLKPGMLLVISARAPCFDRANKMRQVEAALRNAFSRLGLFE